MRRKVIKVLKLIMEGDQNAFASLDGQSRICNWIYNHLLEKAFSLRSEYIQTKNEDVAKMLYTERGLRNQIPELKKAFSFLKSVHSSPLKNAALRLSDSIQAHQKSKKGKRKGNITGWPRFRSWSANWFSLFYDEPNKGFKIQDKTLTLSLGMGEESKRHSIQFELKDADILKDYSIRNLRIVKQAGIYYAVFAVEADLPEEKPISKLIALDPNHKNFSYGVDNEGKSIEIAAPSWLKNYEKRFDELKSKRDRCLRKAHKIDVIDNKGNPTGKTYWEPSKRWKKYNHILEQLRLKRQEQTKTFLYTTAHSLYKNYDCVAIGDYTPDGSGINPKMRRAMNNCSLIGRFKGVLSWVGLKSGKHFIEYDEKGTTRTCSCCQTIVEGGIPPNIRIWECRGCQEIHNRDENAAKNGLQRVLRDLEKKYGTKVPQVPGSGHIHVTEWWAWRVLPSGVKTLRGLNGVSNTASGNLIESVVAFSQK